MISMNQLLLALPLHLMVTLVGGVHYFPDAAYVLNNLDEYSSLSIKFHSCAWSANLAFFDDDGEGRDGDETWYQGRSPSYAANAGFSLYGTKKGISRLGGGGCHRGTYINSFFTDNGADVLVQALGLNAGSNTPSCQRHSNTGLYSTMGCDGKGNFVTATFTDNYCQGQYFANITSDGTYKKYNRALNRINCRKIWSGKKKTTSNGYSSTAHEILQQSQICDSYISADCPNPWGKNAKLFYQQKVTNKSRIMNFFATIFLLMGISLFGFAYFLRIKHRFPEEGVIGAVAKDARKAIARGLRPVASRRKRSLRNRSERSPRDPNKKKRKKDKKKWRKSRRNQDEPGEFEQPSGVYS